MAAVLLVTVLAALAHLKRAKASPWPLHPPSTPDTYAHPANGVCTDYSVTEEISFSEPIYGLPKFQNNLDVASVLIATSRKDTQNVFRPIAGFKNSTKTFTLSGTFCTPKAPKGGKESTVVLATHGVWYDRRYWASTYKPDEHNFAQYVLDAGYSIFYYDRLGTGKSQIISGYENSAPLQLELIAQIGRKIRAGSYTANIKAQKLVLAGHSFGSLTSNAVVAKYPTLADGLIATGVAYGNASLDPFPAGAFSGNFILTVFGIRLANQEGHTWARDWGYTDFVDKYSHAHSFFTQPFDAETVDFAHSIHQPAAILEFFSLMIPKVAAPEFKGPVFITTGANDFLACAGNCTTSYYTAGQQNYVFPAAKAVETYLLPGAGHGTNLASNAKLGFAEIVAFLNRHF